MSKTTFLIVDDAAFMRRVLRGIIETCSDYEIVGEGSTGLEAVELAKELKPDIITMDITMPQMNGLEAVKEILKNTPESRIIMVSAMSQQNIVIDAVKLGAKDFIVKPFEEERVLNAIKRVLES